MVLPIVLEVPDSPDITVMVEAQMTRVEVGHVLKAKIPEVKPADFVVVGQRDLVRRERL